MKNLIRKKLFIVGISALFAFLAFLPITISLQQTDHPEDKNVHGAEEIWYPAHQPEITPIIHGENTITYSSTVGMATGEVTFTAVAITNESMGDFPICYNLPHCNISLTEILYDPQNLLHLPTNVSVCYNKTRMIPPVNLSIGDEIEVYGVYYNGTGPFQYVGHVVVAMDPYYVKLLGVNNPPNAPLKPSGPTTGTIHAAYPYYTAATDPDGDHVCYRFDWDDGTYSIWSPFYNSGTLAYTYHAWSQYGTYQVRAQAMDEYGLTSSWSTYLTVTITTGNAPPNTPPIPTGPTTGAPGSSYSYSAQTTDPEGDEIRYYFDWDDGTGDWTNFVTSGQSVAKSHTWSTMGTYTIRVKAQDEHGAESGWSPTLSVVISGNRAPNQPERPTGSQMGKTGRSYAYSSVTTDPDGNQLHYLFDWGDGTQSSWTGPYSSGQMVTVSHVWENPGTYPLKVKARDSYGEESIWSEPLSLIMPKTDQGKWWSFMESLLEWLATILT